MDEVGLRLVGHQLIVAGIIALPGQEAPECCALLLGQRPAPEAPGVGGVGRHGEVLAVGQLMAKNGGPHCRIDRFVSACAGHGDQRAHGVRAGPALLPGKRAQPTLLGRQRHPVALGERKEARHVGGPVVMRVVVGVRGGAARLNGPVQGGIVQQPVARLAGLLHQRGHAVQGAALPGERREVEH